MNLSLPLSETILAAAKKGPSLNEQRAFAAGVLAHIAIQTFYRLEHPDHFIITERLVTFGDRRITTLSRFGDLSSRGQRLAQLAKKAGTKLAPKKVLKVLESEELWSILAYLLDLSTDLTSKAGTRKKRYDILDFGPLGTSAVFPSKTALAYEIKSVNDVEKGTTYVTRQTSAFNQTVRTLGQTLQNMFSVKGLLGYTAVPGELWPPFGHIIPVGPNVLLFDSAGPGVIAYEWLSFRRVALKRLWELVRKAANEVREAYRREQGLADDVKFLVLFMAAMAVVASGILAVELAGAAAGAGAAATGRALLARMLTAGSLLTSAASRAEEKTGVNDLFEAIANASDPESAHSSDSGQLAGGSGDRSGGTGPTKQEAAVEKMADSISQQFVFLYGVKIGQGDEILDDSAARFIRRSLADWFRAFLSRYGVDSFLELFGVKELNDESALSIAQIIVTNGNLFVERDTYGSLFAELVLMPLEDIMDSLPEGFDDDGELPE